MCTPLKYVISPQAPTKKSCHLHFLSKEMFSDDNQKKFLWMSCKVLEHVSMHREHKRKMVAKVAHHPMETNQKGIFLEII